MKILAIETSCDETGISIIDAQGSLQNGDMRFTVLADELASQAALHSEYGGVYPTLAKREHIKMLPLLLNRALRVKDTSNFQFIIYNFKTILNDLISKFKNNLNKRANSHTTQNYRFPENILNIDAVAVTHGPGLEPALWTGITFAQELAEAWGVPIVPVNHMEGHIFSALMSAEDNFKFKVNCEAREGALGYKILNLKFPTLTLLVSGGHTDIYLIKDNLHYEHLGGTLDDAVGEAFDKCARMLGLGYPGGPIIAQLADKARNKAKTAKQGLAVLALLSGIMSKPLPRPMLHSKDLNFSFSGLKTAVLYKVKEIKKQLAAQQDLAATDYNKATLPQEIVEHIAMEFEDTAAEVLAKKVVQALQEHNAETLIIGGGVSASTYINKIIQEQVAKHIHTEVTIHVPQRSMSGDNALMIAIAGYLRAQAGEYLKDTDELRAHGTLQLS